MRIQRYSQLIVWQKAMNVVDEVYLVTRTFPVEERFGLSPQLRRAAVSIASNIAEGHGRLHRREFVHHLSIANGSLCEMDTQLHIASRQGYLNGDSLERLLALTSEVGRLLRAMRTSLGAPH